MELLLSGLAGVVVGAIVAAVLLLHVFQKRADRDLIERRLRACFEYREALGDIEKAFAASEGDPRVMEQAWRNAADFAREFRRTGWLFGEDVRARFAAIVEEIERAAGEHGANGADAGGRAAQLLCEKGREVDSILRREVEEQIREHRRLRFLPERSAK